MADHCGQSQQCKTNTTIGEGKTMAVRYSDGTVDKYNDGSRWGISMEVVKARHAAAMDHRCHCGNKKDPGKVNRIGSRTWVACERCFGTIKQLS